jgi:hypothetical protein
MTIQDVLGQNEKILVEAGQSHWKPGGSEITPAHVYICDRRIVLETTKMLGLKHEYIDIHYTDVMSVDLKKNIWSSDVIIQSRFKGVVEIKAVKHDKGRLIDQIVSSKIDSYQFGRGQGQGQEQ